MKFLILIFLIFVKGETNLSDTIDSIDSIFSEETVSTIEPVEATEKMEINNTPNSKPLNLTPDESETCECVHYYLCDIPTKTIITDGSNEIINPRLTGTKHRHCRNASLVCCGKDNLKTSTIINVPPSKPKGCGFRNEKGVGFHIEGHKNNESQFGEFPWMLAILLEKTVEKTYKKELVYKCGGSLIHPQVALTAAHCVVAEFNPLKIRAGEWDTQNTNKIYPHQQRNVAKIIKHPKFDRLNLEYDVALLVLDVPLDILEHVNTVCLPPHGLPIFENSRCFASGWGKDLFQNQGQYQTVLKKLELPIVQREECWRLLQTTVLGKKFVLGESFVCAGGEKHQDTCTGDGGSPLVCPMPEQPYKYYQRGIVSWGVDCGQVETPGLYANVAMCRDWIDDEMLKLNYNTSTYTH